MTTPNALIPWMNCGDPILFQLCGPKWLREPDDGDDQEPTCPHCEMCGDEVNSDLRYCGRCGEFI